MEVLELYLSPVSKARFKVFATSSLGVKGDTQSQVPFREGRVDRSRTILKLLEANSFQPKDFQGNGEQDWMVRANLLNRSRKAFHQKKLIHIGQTLYKSIFPSGTRVENVLLQSLARAEEKNTQLHIQLQFAADDIQQVRLPDYPWELMHNGQGFLAHYQVTFSRCIIDDVVPPDRAPVEQVNVLLVSSTAYDTENGYLRFSNQEPQAIRKALKKAEQEGHIHLDQLKSATFDELRAYLGQCRKSEAPDVLHFDGHGFFGQRCNNDLCRKIHRGGRADSCSSCGKPLSERQGYLFFETEGGGANYVSAQEIGVLLHQASFSDDKSQHRGVALVVLSACRSALSLFGNSIFNGVAQSLISHRIPAVVAMQYQVEVSSSATFTEQFYRSLSERNSLALAVSKGREAMGVEGNQWYRPVLYLRWKDSEGGKLFVVPKAATSGSIEQVSQSVSDELVYVSQTQSSTEITKALENASRRTYYRKQAEIWLGDKNYRWNLALILVNKTLESKSLDTYIIHLLQKGENQFRVNIYNCLNWLTDAFQAGKGQNTDKLKEALIKHSYSLNPYKIALHILKHKAKEDFPNNTDVIDTINRYIDNLISRLSI